MERKEQLVKGKPGGGASNIPARPLAKVLCKKGPAISMAGDSASGVDSYVRHNAGLGHNPNLK